MRIRQQAASGVVSSLALFGAFSTLLCCALPALLVSVGAGVAVVGLVSAFPQLIWLSEQKEWLFILVGAVLALSGALRYLARNSPCPADPALAKACMRMRRISFWVFVFALAIYLTGLYFAFIAVYFM